MITSPAITLGTASRPKLSSDGKTVTVTIPITLRRLGGRKQVITPLSSQSRSQQQPQVNATLVKALARAHHWRATLESNLYKSVRDLAKAEGINESYLCRTLRLTLLSPKLTEAILNGRQPPGLDLKKLLTAIPANWEEQEAALRVEE
jgi:hypothetical protein